MSDVPLRSLEHKLSRELLYARRLDEVARV